MCFGTPMYQTQERNELPAFLEDAYKKLAQQNGCDKYTRIPALGINDAFIESLFNLVINKNENQFNNKIFTPKNKCPSNFEKCFCLK